MLMMESCSQYRDRNYQDIENVRHRPDTFQVETRVEDVQQNSKHQQHRPGTENGATAENGSLHRENKGFKGISGPHVLL